MTFGNSLELIDITEQSNELLGGPTDGSAHALDGLDHILDSVLILYAKRAHYSLLDHLVIDLLSRLQSQQPELKGECSGWVQVCGRLEEGDLFRCGDRPLRKGR